MKKQTLAVFGVALLALALSGSLLLAQAIHIDVPFEFMVGEKTLPAGSYEIRRGDNDASLKIRNLDTGDSSVASYLGRLSPREDGKGSVAFDNVNGVHYLSEIYLRGGDGFHLQGAPGKHEHTTLKAKE